MGRSLLTTTYDLLSFDGHGNFGKFDRCFSKAVQFLSAGMDDQVRRKLRNIAFHHLRVTGYIDVSRSDSITKWTLAPATLVQRDTTDFVLIGGSNEAASLYACAPKAALRELGSPDYALELPKDVLFFPNVTQLNTTLEEAMKIADQAGMPVSASYQERIFAHLPSLQSICEAVMAKAGPEALFEPNSASRFNFQNLEWEPYPEMRPLEEGLYKREFDYSTAEYFIATPEMRHFFDIFRLIDREWVVVCALAKLKNKLRLRYLSSEKKLLVSRKLRDLRMPMLLERCFRSGTLLAPKIDQDWTTYGNIAQRSVWKLIAKLPIFQVETV